MLNVIEKMMVNVFKMKDLKMVLGAGVMQNIRNWDIRGRCENKVSLLEKGDRRTLRWFSHTEIMAEERFYEDNL